MQKQIGVHKVIKDINFTKLVLVHYSLISSYENDDSTNYKPISLLYNKNDDTYELKYELVEEDKIQPKENMPFFME